MVFTLKQGDTAPPFVGRCLDAKGQPIPTLGTTVTFRMKPKIAGLRAPISGAATFTDVVTAEATYLWAVGDSDTPGLYDAEFHVVYANGRAETFPNGEYAVVEVLPAA